LPTLVFLLRVPSPPVTAATGLAGAGLPPAAGLPLTAGLPPTAGLPSTAGLPLAAVGLLKPESFDVELKFFWVVLAASYYASNSF